MIGFLKGIAKEVLPFKILLDVKDVGYEINVPLVISSRTKDGEQLELYIKTIVREDAFLLYGFNSSLGKEMFEMLIAVSGVGPSSAIKIMSALTSQELISALKGGDTGTIIKVKGVGKKIAETLVVNLKDKMEKYAEVEGKVVAIEADNPNVDSAIGALMTLGYKRPEAKNAVEKVIKTGLPDTVEEIIKQALSK